MSRTLSPCGRAKGDLAALAAVGRAQRWSPSGDQRTVCAGASAMIGRRVDEVLEAVVITEVAVQLGSVPA
jgi:hypothetical protein